MSPMISDNYFSAYEDISPIGGTDAVYEPAPPPAPEASAPVPSAPSDAYEAAPAYADDTTQVVLPYDAAPAAPPPAAPEYTPEQIQQANDALATLYAQQTPENAEALAPAIAYYESIAFDPNADFHEGPMDDATIDAWATVIDTAMQNFDNMVNGMDDVSADDVIQMQEVMADAAYASAFGAKFEGNDVAAEQAAQLALSYLDSLDASGVDTSAFDAMRADLTALLETGEMDVTYMFEGVHGNVQEGSVTLIGKDDQGVTLDGNDIARLSGGEIPDEFKTVDPDPSTQPGYEGTFPDEPVSAAPLETPPESAPETGGGYDYGDSGAGDYGDYGDGGGDYGDGGGDYGDGGGDYGDAGGGGGGGKFPEVENSEE